MKLKNKLILLGISIGVISCLGLNGLHAAEITSVFNGETISRDNMQDIALISEINSDKVLGISKQRETGNWYAFNPTKDAFNEFNELIVDENGNVEAEKVWKIAEYSSMSSDVRNYNNLYYCLNAERGFGITNGDMAEGAKDTYTNSINMKDNNQKSKIISLSGGSLGNNDNYNKILWILENLYIPGTSSAADKANLLKKAAQYRNIRNNISPYLSDTLIDNNSKIDLTDEQIEIVQQLAIWHFTNGKNITIKSLYKNGKQISGLGNNYDLGNYGGYIVKEGEIIVWKMEALYNYFIEAAPTSSIQTEPKLEISNTDVKIEESGNDFLIGPFKSRVENKELIKDIIEDVKIENVKIEDYKLLNASKSIVENNDFSKVIGNDFYIKVAKSKITTERTNIKIELTYKYNDREITVLTNEIEATSTQPVALIKSAEKDPSVETNAIIEIIDISVIKKWEDSDNQDNVRPDSVKVQLCKNGTSMGNAYKVTLNQSNNWSCEWKKLLNGEYSVKELNASENEVNNNEKYNQYYIATYNVQDNLTTITNTHIPETIQKTVTKIWDDGDNQDGKRAQYGVTLKANGVSITEEVKLNPDTLTYTWNNLPKYQNGVEIKYTVEETSVPAGYTATYSRDTFTITNTHILETIQKTVTKIWDDNSNQDGKRAEYGVTLKANGKVYGEEIKLNPEKLTYTWNNLPKYKDGVEIKYTVEETTVPNEYRAVYSEDTFTITNTYIPGEVSKKVIKEWDDQENRGGIRPDSVTVKLYKTVEGIKTELSSVELKADNEWRYEWVLPKYQDGKNIVYSVEENPVGRYTTSYSDVNYNDTDVITITNSYTPIEITGQYNVVLRKVDSDGNKLEGSKFEVSGIEYDLTTTGEVILYENQQITEENAKNGIDLTYILEETQVPEGYNGIESKEVNIKAQVQKFNNNYKLSRVNLVDGEGNNITDENISIKLENNTSIVIEVKNTPIEKEFDLSLRKFITKINDETYSREPVVDTSTIATTGTATYKHSKQPIAVQKGDVVTYTIRVYNEGEIAGYAETITDHLPDNLLPILSTVDGIDAKKYENEIKFNEKWLWLFEGNTVTTTITSKLNTETYAILTGLENVTDTELEAYVEGSNKLDYIDVQIKCLVTDSAVGGEYLTNIAEITDAKDINDNKGDGFDSELNNVDHSNLSDYKNNQAINSTQESYVPGQEDDDDFEKLVVKEFDLALRKFITKVNETTHSREPKVDTSKLGTIVNGKTVTTATYVHTKEPVIVETSDIVTYKIRIYNEGTIAGFANEITDDIPEGLEFLPNSDINVSYRWEMLDKDGKGTEDVTKAVMITTDYLSDRDSNNIIREVAEVEGTKTLSYKDVEVQFKVIAKAEKLEDNIIINEAQISADSDRDIDSEPNRDEKYDYTTGKNEDDIDYEPIKLQYFDLALRKFITKVNETDYNNRYPEVKFNEDGSITYNHTKEPVLVTTGDTVTYTIRVYNEGEKAGCATEIKDNLPEGLAFDPDNETNKLYGWEMIDEDGNVTEEAEKVVAFKTNYLENEKIDALENGSLSYKDVQIAFIVTESNTSDRILVNTAQISADSDDDIDSIPNNSIESEDDLDKEYVKVEYFDLALKKWVTETRVTLDGKTTNTKTGFTEDSEGIAKVDIVASKLKKTTVKFVYNIKITNEGELPGYAYEVKDYIPSGLKFVAEDNKNWKEEKDNVVITDQLKDTLLNPGESATVEIVLTWKNSSTNLGLKTNYAEISDDSGDDIDSTPDNYDFTEDDIDDAKVILSIKTAGKTTYIGLVLISVAILAGGVFLIKKHVLE